VADGISLEIGDLPFKPFEPGMLLTIIYIIVAAYLLVWIGSYVLHILSERAGQRRIWITTLIPLLKVVVYVSALYLVLQVFLEPSLSELVAFFGLFGAALGLGLKDIFADIVGGIVITFERPYQIGDKISVRGHYGEVIDIGLRSTRITTPDDSVVSIPNYFIFTEPMSSGNAGKTEMLAVIDLYIDHASDAGQAMQILKDAVITSKYVYIAPNRPYTVLLEDFPLYKRIRAKAYVNDLRSEFEFKSEVTRRAWAEMKRQGILPPRLPAGMMDAGASSDERPA
jgi:small-conductance mechanosensitive channel